MADRVSFIQTDLTSYAPDREFDVAIGIGLFDYIKTRSPSSRV